MTTEYASDTAAARKGRGAFFTPSGVAEFLTAWAIRSASDRVLEPSCGDGAFVAATAHQMRTLGGRSPLLAHELHPESAAKTRELLTVLDQPGDVRVGDFLAAPTDPSFDVVVGNPPYVRYQGFTGDARATGRAAALAQGVKLSNLASSWAPFVIHAAAFLNHRGRLALVLPAELLTSNYAQDVRDFLLRRFDEVRIVLIGRQVFPGVQTETVLLLAEGTGGTDQVEFASVDTAGELTQVAFDIVLTVAPGERWNAAIVSTEAHDMLRCLTDLGVSVPLAAWGRVSLGAVTGNNNYFTLSPHQATDLGLASTELVPISPAGSSHLRALRIDHGAHARLGAKGARSLLFRPEAAPSRAGWDYIAKGESEGVDSAYKCRVRSPWWRTPLPEPPDLFFTYMNHGTPQLAANYARLHYLNSVHGLYLEADKVDLAELLALAALNSATALSAEVTGRAYGGGILKMEPREAARLLVPSAEVVRAHETELREVMAAARRSLHEGRLDDVRAMVDAVILDELSSSHIDLATLRRASEAMRHRRHTRARSRAPHPGGPA